MTIPNEVKFVIEELKKQGYEAYLVGGCVRDLLRAVAPLDWDVATNAKPEEIGKIFLRSYADNKFGTVTVLIDSEDPRLKEIEITPYRIESKYTDKRHPDKIKWAKTIEEDLSRRDFTVNAMAIEIQKSKIKNPGRKADSLEGRNDKSKSKIKEKLKIIDLFGGQKDLENKIIKAVGEPDKRFQEDALRLMRAVRFTATLGPGWEIESKTQKAIQKNAGLLQVISKERIRDELMKIIMSERPAEGIESLRKFKLLSYIIPELEEGYGIGQNKHHIYEIYEHSLLSLGYAAKKNFNKHVRLAALFHDIGKSRTKQGEGPDATFYNHEVVGAKMCIKILNRLRFSKKDLEKITKLVRYHLFYYNVDEVSESSVRRLVRQAGPENMEELLQVRMADRIGSGVPKAEPYKLRHLKYVIERVSQDPISVQMLKVNGDDVMTILNIKPGPTVGQILDILLGQVLARPQDNKRPLLEKRIKKLGEELASSLEKLARQAREKRGEILIKRDEMTKAKYWVT